MRKKIRKRIAQGAFKRAVAEVLQRFRRLRPADNGAAESTPPPDASPATTGTQEFLTIYASELQAIGGCAMERYYVESGGTLHGLVGHGGHIVVALATGPGKHAVHRRCSFQLDAEFVQHVHEILFNHFGQQPVGCWHSHHFLGIAGPSGTDDHQAQAFTRDNGLSRYCSIITNTQRKGVRIQAFGYGGPPGMNGVPLKIRVLPGHSPIREAVLQQGLLRPSDLGEPTIPMSLLDFDRYEPEAAAPVVAELADLAQQIAALPPDVQSGLSLSRTEGITIIQLPVSPAVTAMVAVDNKPPHNVREVHLLAGRIAVDRDITSELLRPDQKATLIDIYAVLVKRMVPAMHGSESVQPAVQLSTLVPETDTSDSAVDAI